MSDEITTIEDLVIEEETPPPKPVGRIQAKTKPKRKPKTKKRSVAKTIAAVPKAVIAVPKAVIEKVVSVVAPTPEVSEPEPEEEVDEGPDYSYYPDGTCWLCRRIETNGATVDLIANNGTFRLYMCSDCQTRFRN